MSDTEFSPDGTPSLSAGAQPGSEARVTGAAGKRIDMMQAETATSLKLERKNQDGSLWVIPVEQSPFIIGRKAGVNLLLAAEGVSRQHAEIYSSPDGWQVRDCGSTNGTYVNGRRLTGEHLLREGDYLTIAEIRFDVVEQADLSESTQIINPYTEQFERMIEQQAIAPCFQPLVSLPTGLLMGYEVLGRVNFEGLPNTPGQLFAIARRLGRHVELSVLFRDKALTHAAQCGVKELILFNTLPEEMDLDKLGHSLRRLRASVPGLKLGMELHENAATDVAMMRKLRRLLDELHILLVYDDFGAGQSRLIELLDAVPDILKFDMGLIQSIQQRSGVSRSILETLVKMARDAGIRTLAEGIDGREEAEACCAIGFDLAQGFYYGRPAPLRMSSAADLHH